MKAKLAQIWRRIRHFRSDADLEDELRVHLELNAEDNRARGMSDTEARRRAHLQLGRTRTIVESIRDREFVTALESWYADLLFSLRTLRKTPLFCVTSILTIGLGIGANTAVFSVLYGLLLRSLPVSNPGQLAHIRLVSHVERDDGGGSYIRYSMLQEFSREQHSFTGISAWDDEEVTMQDREGTLRLYDAALVGGNGFLVLGVRPYLGRLLAPSDDVRGSPPEGWPAVLSYAFWQSRFGGDPQIAGKQVKIKDALVTIVGVAPPDFQGVWPGVDPKLYLPFQFINALVGHDVLNTEASHISCSAIGRLRAGVSIRDANAELAVDRKRLFELVSPEDRHRHDFEKATIEAASARTGLPTFFGFEYSEPLFLLQGLVGVVLVLCCINVGGLLMSKVYARQHEFAVRTALGAARWRLIRQYLTESLVLSLAGAALGAVAAWDGSTFLLQFFRHPNMFVGMVVRPDATVFLVTGLLAVLTTLLFGTVPAWRAGRSDPATLLKSRTTLGGRRHLAGRAFVPIQVALSVALVALATLLSQSLVRLRTESPGFDLNHVTIQTPPLHQLNLEADAKLNLYQKMVDRIQQMPGIQTAAVTAYTPMTGDQAIAQFRPVSNSPQSPEESRLAYNEVGPGYFRTMKTAILAGREFEESDRQRNVCVVNQAAAQYLFPREAALGRYVRSSDPRAFPQPVSCRVIGIAQDAKFASLRAAPPRTLYFPVTRETIGEFGNLVFLINSGTKAQAIAAYGAVLKEMVPSIPLVLFVTLREQMDAALGSERLITAMSDVFAALALFLSALGLYGLLSSSVAQRTAEIGMRIALGAERRAVLRMILGEALRLLVVGVLLGAAVLCFVVHLVNGMLYGVSAFDPLTLLGTLAVLAVITLFAGALPALRAASVDPVDALRAE
ncbi:MAG TPA: ABC transporter permease [Bryobacteraceae bacterium]|jgi:predicted permease|nr:ABC transporter permease [Bryobacteraceae bacterium]